MRRSRFSEEQIISVLKEHEAGVKTFALCRQALDLGRHTVQMEGEVRGARRLQRWRGFARLRTRTGGSRSC